MAAVNHPKSNCNPSKKLLVVGGADGIGNWLVRKVFATVPDVERITLMDSKALSSIPVQAFHNEYRELEKTIDAISHECGVDSWSVEPRWQAVVTKALKASGPLRLCEYDVVMIAVPEQAITQVCKEILPKLRNDVWVFDVCSVKDAPIKSMLRSSVPGASIVGTHPLFGPAVGALVGQRMVMVRSSQTFEPHYEWLANLYSDRGALVVDADAVSHDKYMLYVQSLTHFLYLSFAKGLAYAMREDGFSLGESYKYMTPPYASIIAFMGRIVAGNPRIYAQIQAASASVKARKLLAQAVKELATSLEDAGEEKCKAAITEIVDAFSASDVGEGAAIASAYTEHLQDYFDGVHKHKLCGDLVIIQDAGSPPSKRGNRARQEKRTYAGIITAFDHKGITLQEQSTLRDGKWYLIYDELSRRAFAESALGIAEPTIKTVRIPHKHARVLSADNTREWRRQNLAHTSFDLPIVAEESATRSASLSDTLVLLCPNVLRVEAREAAQTGWLARYGLSNVLLHVEVFGDRPVSVVQESIVSRLKQQGVHVFQEPHQDGDGSRGEQGSSLAANRHRESTGRAIASPVRPR